MIDFALSTPAGAVPLPAEGRGDYGWLAVGILASVIVLAMLVIITRLTDTDEEARGLAVERGGISDAVTAEDDEDATSSSRSGAAAATTVTDDTKSLAGPAYLDDEAPPSIPDSHEKQRDPTEEWEEPPL